MADISYFMGNNMFFQSMGTLEFSGVTDLYFNFNKDGNILKAVPREITDSSGTKYTVLALVPNS